MIEIDRARAAMQYLPADTDRDTWVRHLTAMKAADIPEDEARGWSQQADSYNARDFTDTWRSINPNGGITEATLFYEAQKNGYEHTPIAANTSTTKETQQAKTWAASLWKAARPVVSHPYLTRKGVKPVATLKQIDVTTAASIIDYMPKTSKGNLTGMLLLAIGKRGNDVATAEFIDENGNKAALRGNGTRSGAYWATGAIKQPTSIYVCEGVATALSVYEATNTHTIASFSNSNMVNVAKAMRQAHPNAEIVLCADLVKDTGEIDNKAIEAAEAIQGLVAVPRFTKPMNAGDKDFNDLFVNEGIEAVRTSIDNAYIAGWSEPSPLPKLLSDVQAFDVRLLPENLRAWVQDIAHRMQQPLDFAAVGAVVALSSVLGARAVIRPKKFDDWEIVPNLWGMLIGRPSTGKSPTLKAVLTPLNRLEAGEREKHEEAIEQWQAECELVELQQADNKKQARGAANKNPDRARELLTKIEPPPEPAMRRYIVNNSTVEKLGEILQVNPYGLLVYQDELYGLLKSMDTQGQETARAFYLQAFNGNQGFAFDRIQRGEVYIPRVCVAMLGGIQPARLHDYVLNAVEGGAGDDGLLQRFSLAVYPDINQAFNLIDQYPDTEARQTANDVFDRLAALEPDEDGKPRTYNFDSEAQAEFNDWYTKHMTRLRKGDMPPALESHYGKYPDLVTSLALIFALTDAPECKAINKAAFRLAISWSQYLSTHAQRIYGIAAKSDISAAYALLERIKSGAVNDGFKVKDVQQNGWAGLGNTPTVKSALEVLNEHGYVKQVITKSTDKQGRGRPSESYKIHPKLLKED